MLAASRIPVMFHRFLENLLENWDLTRQLRASYFRQLAVIPPIGNILGKYAKTITTGQLTAQIHPKTRHLAETPKWRIWPVKTKHLCQANRITHLWHLHYRPLERLTSIQSEWARSSASIKYLNLTLNPSHVNAFFVFLKAQYKSIYKRNEHFATPEVD